MAENKDAGQGKLPLVVVTDNALLKRKYEQDELEGKVPVMASTSLSGGIKVADGFASIVKTDFVPSILLTLSASATYAQTGTTVTVSATGHNGINRASPTGLRIFWPGSAAIPSGWYDGYTYIDANTFSFTNPVSQTVAAGAAITGTAKNAYIAFCAFQLPAELASEGAMVTHEAFVFCDTTAATKLVRTRVGGNAGGYYGFTGAGAFGKRDVTTMWRSGRWYSAQQSDGTPSGGMSSAIFDPANSLIELCAFSASDNACVLIDAVKVRYVP